MRDHLSVIKTADGSNTLFHPGVGEHYHSIHGALQEAKHVFLQEGLIRFLQGTGQTSVSILEAGFGTGLNFLVTADHALKARIDIEYTGIEPHPPNINLIRQLGYEQYIDPIAWKNFNEHYHTMLERPVKLMPELLAEIVTAELLAYRSDKRSDIIYYDAFAPVHQPEMWNEESIKHISSFLKPGGIFVTYSITGALKRLLKSLNFAIEKPKGAPGKREMLRAIKMSEEKQVLSE